jgi:hypothetical protein
VRARRAAIGLETTQQNKTNTEVLMKRTIGSILASLALVAIASSAQAQLATIWNWTVPGVSDNGATKTYFACTNNGTVAATVGVQVYGPTGTALNSVAATELTLNPNETRLFATTAAGIFIADANLAVTGFSTGSARILASESKRINCSAWIYAGVNGMVKLSVVKKNTQKGQ